MSTNPLRTHFPGLLYVALLSLLGFWLSQTQLVRQWGLGALTVAILLGMLLANLLPLFNHPRLQLGILFSKNTLLRWGIILYGFRLTLTQVSELGISGLLSDVLMLSCTFVLCYLMGRKLLGLDAHTSALIGAGSSICGAAAVIATGSTIKAPQHAQACAIATVVIFGSLSLLLYPVLYRYGLWPLDDHFFALYIGSSVHEVAQVVAAGQAISPEIADTAIISKMLRVMLLAPFLLILPRCLTFTTSNTNRQLPIPWFAFGFLAVMLFNSYIHLPEQGLQLLHSLGDILLGMAMLALGLNTSISALKNAGMKPIALGAIAWVWLVVGGAAVHSMLYGLLG